MIVAALHGLLDRAMLVPAAPADVAERIVVRTRGGGAGLGNSRPADVDLVSRGDRGKADLRAAVAALAVLALGEDAA